MYCKGSMEEGFLHYWPFVRGIHWLILESPHQWAVMWCFNIFLILAWTRTTRTPAFWGYPPPPNDYPYHWVILDPKSKEDKVKVTNLKNSPKFHYTRHTFWSCLIRCANMKWIRWVLLKIQSGHDSVHRRTDEQTDRRTRWYQYTPLSTSLKGGGV